MKLTYKHTVFTCYLANIGAAAANNLASLLFIIFQNEFGLSSIQLATVISVNFMTQIVVDFLGAKYADKLGYRRTVLLSASLLTLGLLSLGVFPLLMPDNMFTALCMSAVIYAIGSGLGEVILSPIIEALPGDAKESAMSIMHSFYCWGHVCVVVLSTLYFQVFGTDHWQILPMIWAIVPLTTVFLFSVTPIRSLNEDKVSLPLRKLFTVKIFWLFMLLMLCGGAAELAMAQWSSLFAESALGVSKTVGNLLGPCFFAVMMGSARALYGKYSEKLPLISAIIVCSFITCAGYLMVSLIPNPYVALIGCGIIGFGVGIFWPGTLSVASKAIPTGGAGMFAILALFGDFGCSVGPQLAAVVSEAFDNNLKIGMLACTLFPLVILISTLVYVKFSIRKNKSCKQTENL